MNGQNVPYLSITRQYHQVLKSQIDVHILGNLINVFVVLLLFFIVIVKNEKI